MSSDYDPFSESTLSNGAATMTTGWSASDGSLDFMTLRRGYAAGCIRPTSVVDAVYDRIEARGKDPTWITLVPRNEALHAARALERRADAATLRLFGIPMSVKDNFDIAGLPTTEGCRAYERMASSTNPIVQRLIDAGAILIGKTNMDQFGVGLMGVRTDYGAPRCAFDSDYISGGSTSGGGVTVAAGLVSFALGNDAAGSGRVPAALNNIVGLKLTPGLISLGSTSLAGMNASHSILALTVEDAVMATQVIIGYDADDPLSRPEADGFTLRCGSVPSQFRFGIPSISTRIFYGDSEAQRLFEDALARLRALGGEAVELDFAKFYAVARMLYEDAFVARRYANLRKFFDAHHADIHPATREIVFWGRDYSGADVFEAQHRLARLTRAINEMTTGLDFIVTPTTPTTFRVAEVEQDNITLNAALGTYTNFVNLLNMCALALPAGLRSDGKPLGISFVAPAMQENRILSLGTAYHASLGGALGATRHPVPTSTRGTSK